MNLAVAIRSFWDKFQIMAGSNVPERFYEAFHFDDSKSAARAFDRVDVADLTLMHWDHHLPSIKCSLTQN